MICLTILFSCPQLRIDSNEGGGEHALPEEVAQQVRNADSRAENAGDRCVAEKICNDAFADEPGQAADQDSECDARGCAKRITRFRDCCES